MTLLTLYGWPERRTAWCEDDAFPETQPGEEKSKRLEIGLGEKL